jgi:anion-transporting  ArsA/GET3 family ATPase
VSTRVLVITGAGGVGKTTLSAALGVTAARNGFRSCVITVDPAQRLADALGIESLGNLPEPVSGQPDLSAAMLDATAAWEAIVQRHAEPDVADRLLGDPFFRAIADRFPAAQAYAAGEQMADHIESNHWDLLVVDTPPAGGGLDFYTAPRQIQELVGGRLLRWLTGASIPGRRALYLITARPALRIADTILGGPLLEGLAEFLLDLRTLYDGLSRRARGIENHLRRATSIVVTTAQPTPLREARRFFEELDDAAARPGTVVFNKQLPEEWATAANLRSPGIPAEVRAAAKENMSRWAGEVRLQHDMKQEFAARYGLNLVDVPWVADAPTSVAALAELLSLSPELAAYVA